MKKHRLDGLEALLVLGVGAALGVLMVAACEVFCGSQTISDDPDAPLFI